MVEFASVVDAVRCAVDVQREMAGRNAGVPAETRIEFRVGINLGDIIIDGDDIFGDGVNVAARLETLAEPGGICVSRVVRDQVRDKLAFAFEDMGEQQVKNIARPVRVYRVRDDSRRRRDAHRRRQLPALPLPDKPSIAVLPFANMSGDPEQEYFADGMVEEIITALSRMRWLFVIARNSSFTYKGHAVDVKQVGTRTGRALRPRRRVRKAGNRVRITAQLIDTANGGASLGRPLRWLARRHLRACRTRWHRALPASSSRHCRPAETGARSASRPTTILTAYDLYLRALRRVSKNSTQSGWGEAVILSTRALAIDHDYAPAAALIGVVSRAAGGCRRAGVGV